jgi:hypothetical protein
VERFISVDAPLLRCEFCWRALINVSQQIKRQSGRIRIVGFTLAADNITKRRLLRTGIAVVLVPVHDCESRCLARREDCRLRMFETKALRIRFGLKRDEILKRYGRKN